MNRKLKKDLTYSGIVLLLFILAILFVKACSPGDLKPYTAPDNVPVAEETPEVPKELEGDKTGELVEESLDTIKEIQEETDRVFEESKQQIEERIEAIEQEKQAIEKEQGAAVTQEEKEQEETIEPPKVITTDTDFRSIQELADKLGMSIYQKDQPVELDMPESEGINDADPCRGIPNCVND